MFTRNHGCDIVLAELLAASAPDLGLGLDPGPSNFSASAVLVFDHFELHRSALALHCRANSPGYALGNQGTIT
jgi:hypothetical protein